MEDIKIIKEFFSKPLDEINGSSQTEWPKEVPSRYGDIIFRLVKVMPDRAKYELIDAETGKTWEVGGRVYGTVNQLKASAEDTIKPQGGRQSSQFESVNEAKTYKKGDKLKIKLKNGKEFDLTFDSYGRQKGMAFGKFKDGSGEYDTKPFNLDTIVESVNEELNLSNYGKVTPPKGIAKINEATEDAIDAITMDVPLFIRILEYSREDAQEDMDLHDVAEKAILLNKEKGILSMEDYNEIVGRAEEIKEGIGNEVGDKVYFKGDMGEKYPFSQGYYGIIEDTTPARNYNMMATYDVVVYDKNDNEIRTITTDFTNLTNKKVNESEIDDLAKELANAVEDKLEDKKDEVNEVIDPISILSYVLAGTTLTNIIAKYVGKLSKKYNFGKGEAAAKKIYDFTHKLESDFKKPIGRVVGLFTKDEKQKSLVTDGLFALLLLGLGAKAGTEAFSAIRKSNLITGGVSALKAALKGKDLAKLVQDTIQDTISAV
jgi:hypothetical protein